jgi:cell division protease FtsH
VRTIIDSCYEEAKKLLETNRDKLELMKDALMEYETIDLEQINDIMKGNVPRPPADWSDQDKNDTGAGQAQKKEEPESDSKIGGPASEH